MVPLNHPHHFHHYILYYIPLFLFQIIRERTNKSFTIPHHRDPFAFTSHISHSISTSFSQNLPYFGSHSGSPHLQIHFFVSTLSEKKYFIFFRNPEKTDHVFILACIMHVCAPTYRLQSFPLSHIEWIYCNCFIPF